MFTCMCVFMRMWFSRRRATMVPLTIVSLCAYTVSSRCLALVFVRSCRYRRRKRHRFHDRLLHWHHHRHKHLTRPHYRQHNHHHTILRSQIPSSLSSPYSWFRFSVDTPPYVQVAKALDDHGHPHISSEWQLCCSASSLRLQALKQLVHHAKAKEVSWKWWERGVFCGLFVRAAEEFDAVADLCRVVPVAYTHLSQWVLANATPSPDTLPSDSSASDSGEQHSEGKSADAVAAARTLNEQRCVQIAHRFVAMLSLGHLHQHAGCVALALDQRCLPSALRTFPAAMAALTRVLDRGRRMVSVPAHDAFKRDMKTVCEDALRVVQGDLNFDI